MKFPLPSQVQLGGLLGQALAANHDGRLTHFVVDETSPAIALFAPQRAQHNHEGDWYGEHAGKWLYAAARAANRTSDEQLAARVRRVADYLVSVQEPNGYLGTYAPARRFMNKQPLAARTWDGAPSQRTWDLWTHSYLMLGLLEVQKYFPAAAYLAAASRMGDLCWHTLTEGGIDITRLGNHHGMSATVLLDAAVELYFATGNDTYLDLARLILKQADERAELQLLTQALAGVDASEIATGKAYQLCWNLVGMAKLQRATGDPQVMEAVNRLWESVRQYHLTLGGGPWGGVAHRSREVFNHHTVFSPYGYVETCSLLAWVQLNRELLGITGEAKYADEIERTACNDLVGAQAANGEDWCYYSFPNGKRVHTTYWRCCKSSGAMALEELPALAYGITPGNGVAINLYGPGKATLSLPQADTVRVEQRTQYPFDGRIEILIDPQRSAKFSVSLRIPAWAERAEIRINGDEWTGLATPGTFAVVERVWKKGDKITLSLPMPPVLHRKSSNSVQESRAPDGEPVHQQVMHYDYIAISRGPLVYSTGLIDGFKSAETIRFAGDEQQALELVQENGEAAPSIRLNLRERSPLLFVPYYSAGGRVDGAWRLTWLQVT